MDSTRPGYFPRKALEPGCLTLETNVRWGLYRQLYNVKFNLEAFFVKIEPNMYQLLGSNARRKLTG